MFNFKREKIKKNIFLALSVVSAFIFIAGIMCTVMGDNSPVKFIVNDSPVKLIVPPVLIFFITYALYRNSKRVIKENEK